MTAATYTTRVGILVDGAAVVEDVTTTGTQDAHRKAVHARVEASRAAHRARLEAARNAAYEALQATYGKVSLIYPKSPEQIAEDGRNRANANRLRSAWSEAELAVKAYDERRKGFFRWTSPCTPDQARRAVRAARRQTAPKPSAAAFSAGSWVRWTDPGTDTERTGVVTCDGWSYTGKIPTGQTTTRYIVPADGGDMLPMCPRAGASGGDWRCQSPDWKETADVFPAPVPQ